jgi:bifunctional non-homologous end joining protein LigD
VGTPQFIEPMLAKLTTLPADDARWAFEIKWDGVRAIARSEPGSLRLFSRNGNDITAAYPELQGLNGALGAHTAVLDGEIVALDAKGRPSFQALQTRMHQRTVSVVELLSETAPVTYMVFDLLWLDGLSLTELPYSERRAALDALELNAARWRVSEFHVGDGEGLLAATREQGLEGLVAKRLDSRYLPGKRSGWAKIKNSMRQELVVGGWTSGKGARSNRIGALLVGVRDDEIGGLRYSGRVGTGFDAEELERLAELLAPLARTTTPFSGSSQPPKGSHFVEPELVCEVEFSEWTEAGTLRQPSYKGLRNDKPSVDVVRERIVTPDESSSDAPPPEGRRPHSSAVDIRELIAGGRRVRDGIEIEVEGRTLKVTNSDKVLYPATGFTKTDVIAYYAGVAPVLLPHLHNRPLTLKRYPQGVDREYFYEKRSPKHRPEWVQTVDVATGRQGVIPFTLCQDLPTLVWLANLADIELHPSLSLADDSLRPTTLVFDLDPGPPADIVKCCAVALELSEMFEQLGISAFAKTSGSKGLQVYVPLNDPDATYEQTKPFAHAVASLFEERRPELVVSDMAKAKRAGKVLIDWSQNDDHKTTVNVYSLRATERPGVSTPLDWAEVNACAESNESQLLSFTPEQLLTRVAERGDLFAKILSMQQQLPNLVA